MTGRREPVAPGVFDVGLQPERTALSWRRTGLSVCAGSLIAARILPEVFGLWALVPGMIGVAAAIVLLVLAERRYRRVHAMLMASAHPRVSLASGTLPAVLALLTLFLGLSGLVVALAVAL
jgi:putative membrane protein